MENEEVQEVIEEQTPDTEVESVEEESIETEDIPPELDGLSEETIKEAMAELNQQEQEDTAGDNEDTDSHAEPDSVKKQSSETVFDRPKQNIPYERFKQEVDAKNSLKAEVEALKAQLSTMQTQGTGQSPQQIQKRSAPQQPTQAQMRFTPEATRQIETAIRQRALQLTGFSEEDADSLTYADDDDIRAKQWAYANDVAKTEVMSAIQQAQHQQMERNRQIIANHEKVRDDYNAFVTEQQSDPNFDEFKTHATGDYFNKLPQSEQPVIADAYVRIERNTASPQDIALIKRFFTDAKNDYLKKNGKPKMSKSAASKLQQADAHPRASQVSGSAASTGTPSVEALERMLNEKNWEEIPEEYRNILKGL